MRSHITKLLDLVATELWQRVLKKHYEEWEYQRMREREDLWREIMESADGEE